MRDLDKIYAENIAKEYAPKPERTKVNQLKKLDEKVKRPAFIFALSFGIISALILGVGMCFSLKQFGDSQLYLILGVVIGVIGIIMCSINYPIYKHLLEKGKKKYAFEIIELAKEISEN